MNYKWAGFKSKNGRARLVFVILTLLVIFLFSFILPENIKAYSEENYQNYFHFKAINNTLSVIESSNMEEKHTETNNTIRFSVLSFLGINISNPISIITKESAYLSSNGFKSSIKVEKIEDIKTFILNPFKLEEKQINKLPEKSEGNNQVAKLDNPDIKKY